MESYKLEFNEQALHDLDALDQGARVRIIDKLEWFSQQSNPTSFARRLHGSECGEYRFRIGDYRVIFDFEKNVIKVLRIGHRSTIYR